ncbi:MAG: EVE domain-containing protein, partial [Leptospiraceae bacterium]|nr:EVE domain-containing protein [Leptospiraceae bacterium]
MNYWLFKSEPETFSIDDLKNSPGKISSWEGVRNYQARNFLRDEIRKGDQVLFYHSNAKPPGVVGLAEVVKEG